MATAHNRTDIESREGPAQARQKDEGFAERTAQEAVGENK